MHIYGFHVNGGVEGVFRSNKGLVCGETHSPSGRAPFENLSLGIPQMTPRDAAKIRMTKSEGRKKSEGRNPKAQSRINAKGNFLTG
jgi:hypothetical protein